MKTIVPARDSGAVLALLGVFTLVVATGCRSSAPHGGPPNAGLAVAVGVTGAAVNRVVTGECLAVCHPSMICDKATGLCVERRTALEAPATQRAVAGPRRPRSLLAEPIPEGSEYEVPPLDAQSEPHSP